MTTKRSVLSIAGSDSSGGAGIQADIKTIEALGLFAQTAITALTAQNTTGVFGTYQVDPAFVEAQIDAVFDDIRPAAVKVGMVSSGAIVEAIAEALERHQAENVVVDPVMVSTSGAKLIDDGAKDALVGTLFPHATVITPNMPEAQVLSGEAIASKVDQEHVARLLASTYGCAVLVKGGHGENEANDVLVDAAGNAHWFSAPRIETENTHGTGCTLSSAIACGLACGLPLEKAVEQAKSYLYGALASGLDLGHGNGPVDHFWQRG